MRRGAQRSTQRTPGQCMQRAASLRADSSAHCGCAAERAATPLAARTGDAVRQPAGWPQPRPSRAAAPLSASAHPCPAPGAFESRESKRDRAKDPSQVPLVQDDHMVSTPAPSTLRHLPVWVIAERLETLAVRPGMRRSAGAGVPSLEKTSMAAPSRTISPGCSSPASTRRMASASVATSTHFMGPLQRGQVLTSTFHTCLNIQAQGRLLPKLCGSSVSSPPRMLSRPSSSCSLSSSSSGLATAGAVLTRLVGVAMNDC